MVRLRLVTAFPNPKSYVKPFLTFGIRCRVDGSGQRVAPMGTRGGRGRNSHSG